MGILDGIMGNATEVSLEKITEEFAPILIEGETLEKAKAKKTGIAIRTLTPSKTVGF